MRRAFVGGSRSVSRPDWPSAQQLGPGGYPNKPVKIIVPFAPAARPTSTARLIAQKLSRHPEAAVLHREPGRRRRQHRHGPGRQGRADGYTILFVSSSLRVNPSLYDKVPYDTYKDFAPLTLAATGAERAAGQSERVPVEDVEGAGRLSSRPIPASTPSPRPAPAPRRISSGELFKLTFKLDTGARAVRRRGPGDPVDHRRPHAARLHLAAAGGAAHQGRHSCARSRSTNNKRVAVLPGRADAGRSRHPDQEADTSRRAGAGRHAEGHRRLHLSGGREGDEVAGRHRQDGAARPRDHLQHAEQFTQQIKARSPSGAR